LVKKLVNDILTSQDCKKKESDIDNLDICGKLSYNTLFAHNTFSGGVIMKTTGAILAMILSTICFGYSSVDFNKDGIVDFFDFATFSKQWLEESELELKKEVK
jgi:hypothetical protein